LASFTSLELSLTRTIAEKDAARSKQKTLLRKINHRVANSLQLAAGMLRLQRNREDEARMREKLEIAAQRIASIQHVHDRRYRSGRSRLSK
jgi:two-component sensor histidine kinase